jgi:2-polyprenyl-3-methyl-5-hydroxy-6-metoxy-1,4-benzoquinol methylase
MSYTKQLVDNTYYTVAPKPSMEELRAFYQQQYFNSQTSNNGYEQSYTEPEIQHKELLADVLLYGVGCLKPELLKPGSRLLDIGCGEGFNLAAAAKAGLNGSGVDFTLDGIRAFHPELQDAVRVGDAYEILDQLIQAGEKFDICILQHVLEHVLAPEQLMAHLGRILSENGVLIITVPNDYSVIQLKALELGLIDREFWFAPPEHLNYYNAASLQQFVQACGYQILDCYGTFPIDFFLFHPGSNYIADKSAGKPAAKARVALDLCLAQAGLAPYLGFCQALVACGAGRSITITLQPNRRESQ